MGKYNLQVRKGAVVFTKKTEPDPAPKAAPAKTPYAKASEKS